jgi:branched-chain amino acid aminotransferase
MRVRIDVLAAPAVALGTTSRELIALQPFTPPPPELYETGVTVDFAEGLSRDRPLVKAAGFAEKRPGTAGLSQLEAGARAQMPEDRRAAGRDASSVVPYEYLLLDAGGRILEGTGTNFWAVTNGTVYTAGEGVLEGITREILLDLIPSLGIPVKLQAIAVDAITSLDEAALSGSSRAFLPVVSIAGRPVGDGRPGPISRRILQAYNEFVAENIRPATFGGESSARGANATM